MNLWTTVRVALLAVGFLQGALSSHVLGPSEGVTAFLLVVVFAFGLVGVLFVVGVQRINPWSAPKWRYPSWSINPFLLREPLQFFHFAGFFFIAGGVGNALRQLFLGQELQLSSLFLPAVGIGAIAGVYACTFAYRGKMAHPRST